MGMSSSQARLLSLTSRQHDIEYKAQRLEAQKLQMANESNAVYNDYVLALDATKLQYRYINSDGTTTAKDATLNMLENGIIGDTQASSEPLFLQATDSDKIYLTPKVAKEYGLKEGESITGTMDDYLKSLNYTPIPEYNNLIPDDKVITSINPTRNSDVTEPGTTYNYSGAVNNTTKKVDETFTNTISSSTTTLTSGKTYIISDASGLQKLSELVNNGVDTTNVNIVLMNNIDMSSQSLTTIGSSSTNGFKGTFNGNGYTISNLTMNTSGNAALFGYVVGGTIENLTLANESITSTNGHSAGLALNIDSNSTVSNVSTSGTISGNSWCAGLISSSSGVVTNCSSSASVTASGYSGGLFGVVGGSANSTITNCYSTGTVTGLAGGDGRIGGFAGQCNAQCSITNSYSTSTVNGSANYVGGFIGWANSGNITRCYASGIATGTGDQIGGFAGNSQPSSQMVFENCVYNNANSKDVGSSNNSTGLNGLSLANIKTSSSMSPYGFTSSNGWNYNGTTTPTITPVSYTQINIPQTDTTISHNEYTIPSDTGLASNIYAALIKSGNFNAVTTTDAEKAEMLNKINTFVQSFSDNASLYNLNTNLYNSLTGTTNTEFLNALNTDIQAGTKTATATYQSGTVTSSDIISKNTDDETWNAVTSNKGTVTTPTLNSIATNIYSAIRNSGDTVITQDQVTTWLTNQYGNDNNDNNVILANINQLISDYKDGKKTATDLKALSKSITDGNKYNYTDYYDPSEYTGTRGTNNDACGCTYGQQLDLKNPSGYHWDTSDSKIKNAMLAYAMSQRGIIIVSEDLSNKNEYVTNMIKNGKAVLTSFNPANLLNVTSEALTKMSDKEYREFMGIVNTSVSTNTNIFETSDTSKLKKAEATYEARTRKINNKEALIDTQLTACETERKAITEEEDTLKQVIKNNVDLSFKLFS